MTNKVGDRLEENFALLLSTRGNFWVYRFPHKNSGQPADIIAVKNRLAYLFDCKHCQHGSFSFSRIEPNQEVSFKYWEEKGNGSAYFYLYFEEEKGGDEEYLIPFSVITYFKNLGYESITPKRIEEYEERFNTNLSFSYWWREQ